MTFDPSEMVAFAESLLQVDETTQTGQHLAGIAGKLSTQWLEAKRCKANDIPLPLPRDKAFFPADCVPEAASLSFTYEPGPTPHFPVIFDCQVKLSAAIVSETVLFQLEDHWRVDTHVAEGGNAPHEPHAQFHFQRGGHAQDLFASHPEFLPGAHASITGEFRGLFQCPGPRMPALPMDPVLAIDFCIGQANGKVWQRLRNVPEYFSAVERSQERVWAPFFAALAGKEFQRTWLGAIVI